MAPAPELAMDDTQLGEPGQGRNLPSTTPVRAVAVSEFDAAEPAQDDKAKASAIAPRVPIRIAAVLRFFICMHLFYDEYTAMAILRLWRNSYSITKQAYSLDFHLAAIPRLHE